MDCPKCIGKLKKVEVTVHDIPKVLKQKGAEITKLELDQCPVCMGVWFDSGELQKYIKKKITCVDSPEVDLDIYIDIDRKIVKCPRCSVEMLKKPAPLREDIIMDVCPNCGGIWLDSGEIDKIEAENLSFIEKIAIITEQMIKSMF